MATKKFPVVPANPERLCWGCDRYCAADNMLCGNGSDRTQHPSELFGPDWQQWSPPDPAAPPAPDLAAAQPPVPDAGPAPAGAPGEAPA